MNETICEECNGTGIETLIGWNHAGTRSQRYEQDCWACNGHGVVPVDPIHDDDSVLDDIAALDVPASKGLGMAD